jgi:hypothetical protein
MGVDAIPGVDVADGNTSVGGESDAREAPFSMRSLPRQRKYEARRPRFEGHARSKCHVVDTLHIVLPNDITYIRAYPD